VGIIRAIQTNFTAGELTPRLTGQVDFARYPNGAETIKNAVVMRHGGAARRPGTYFVAEAKLGATRRCRLVPFEFSTTQAYILEFGHQYIRFYKDGAQITDGGSPYEIGTSYDEDHLFELQFAQSADVLYIAHPDYAPAKLSRTGHTSWTLAEIPFRPAPTAEQGWYPDATITPGATSGTGVTFTASWGLFLAGDVNRSIIAGTSRAIITSVTDSSHVVCDILDEFESTDPIASGSWYLSGSPTATVTPDKSGPPGSIVTLTASDDCFREDDLGSYMTIHGGYVKLTQFNLSTEFKGEILEELSGTTGTADWSLEQPVWTDQNGYPGAVALHEERLFFAGSPAFPQTVWGSCTNDYENHTAGANDSNAVAFTVAAGQVNRIRWLQTAQGVLLAGTTSAEWKVSGSDVSGGPITPTSIHIQRQTRHGSAWVEPEPVESSVLFLQRAGRKIRELTYQFEKDGYVAPDLTQLAEHLTSGGIVQMAFQQEPESVLWAVRSDGALLGMTYDRSQDVVAWHEHELGGTDAAVESVAVIPADFSVTAADEDQVWLSVRRTVDGAVVRQICYLMPFAFGDDQEDAFFVDAGLSYDGAPSTTFSGLDHLEGETLSVLADGAVHPDRTVSGGQITLEKAASVVHAGLAYETIVKTMPLERALPTGTLQGRLQRVVKAVVRFYRTLGATVGASAGEQETVPWRSATDPMDSPPPLFTGDKEVLFPGDWDTKAQVEVRLNLPLPLTVNAIIMEVEVNQQ